MYFTFLFSNNTFKVSILRKLLCFSKVAIYYIINVIIIKICINKIIILFYTSKVAKSNYNATAQIF